MTMTSTTRVRLAAWALLSSTAWIATGCRDSNADLVDTGSNTGGPDASVVLPDANVIGRFDGGQIPLDPPELGGASPAGVVGEKQMATGQPDGKGR
jgi:hypothetical protein